MSDGFFDGFEWDPDKSDWTRRTRGFGFERAMLVFDDPFYLELADDREEYGEPRNVAVGVVQDLESVIAVVWTPRGRKRRIVSARLAGRAEKAEYRKWRDGF